MVDKDDYITSAGCLAIIMKPAVVAAKYASILAGVYAVGDGNISLSDMSYLVLGGAGYLATNSILSSWAESELNGKFVKLDEKITEGLEKLLKDKQ